MSKGGKSSIFLPAQYPVFQQPPEPVPISTPADVDAGDKLRARQKRKRGRASTILSSPNLGNVSQTENQSFARRTLGGN